MGRKVVTEEMIANAVDHIRNKGENPSRGKVMSFMARPENGGCGGDPENVTRMINAYLVSIRASANVPAPASAGPVALLPARIETALAKETEDLSATMCSLSELLATELADIKADLAAKYDVIVSQVRQEAEGAVAAAKSDEQDALAALSEALYSKDNLEGELRLARADAAGATAIAAERGEQVSEHEAVAERNRVESAALVASLRAELDAVRAEAREGAILASERSARISGLDAALSATQAELAAAREEAVAARAVADERAVRLGDLEVQLDMAMPREKNSLQKSVGAPANDDPGLGHVEVCVTKPGRRNKANNGSGQKAEPRTGRAVPAKGSKMTTAENRPHRTDGLAEPEATP